MERRKCCKIFGALIAVLVAFGLFYFTYLCPDNVCVLKQNLHPLPAAVPLNRDAVTFNKTFTTSTQVIPGTQMPITERKNWEFSPDLLNRDYQDFDGDEEDVLVFLHIQKTGGTVFGRHLVKNMVLESPCKCRQGRKKCDCKTQHNNHIWLFSRFSTGWSCGLHADWIELKTCVDDMMDKKEGFQRTRRYLYITILREPVSRYLSEWKHVQRGATWLNAKLRCNGRPATLEEVPFCFEGDDWSGVSLDDFMKCDSNLAINRQVRMLANLSLVHCYNKSAMSAEVRDSILLQSAKDNLADMSFFGLTEFQKETQYLFERTFKLKFIDDFEQKNETTASRTDLSAKDFDHVRKINHLDIQLYEYAKELFFQRLKLQQQEDRSIRDNSTDNGR